MKLITGLEKVVNGITKIFQTIAMALLFFMMSITVIDVVGRYFSVPLKGTFELTNYTLALVVFLGLAFAQLEKAHITIDFIVEKFSMGVQHLINILWYIVMFVLLSLLGWQMLQYSLRNLGSKSAELQLPVSAILIAGSVGVFLYALKALIDLIKEVYEGVQSRVS